MACLASISKNDVPVIAFDCDSTLCGNESDSAYQEGKSSEEKLRAFQAHEARNHGKVMGDGPLRDFATALSKLRDKHPYDKPPFRIAMITSRDFQYCERPILTFRDWGLRLDEAFFVSDMSKDVILQALRPLIFFDDSKKHCDDAMASTPTVQIPSTIAHVLGSDVIPVDSRPNDPNTFLTVCKLFLKTDFTKYEQTLVDWHTKELHVLEPARAAEFVSELERSARSTPKGKQRRSATSENSDFLKFMLFLENLKRKYSKHTTTE
jgi:hypothetical protein